jgi:hypothetical protein
MIDVLNINDLDGRTRFVRRARVLAREFISALGGAPAPHELIMIRSAAELTAVAEKVRAALLAGDTAVTLNDLVRSENAMSRAIRALNIPTAAAKPSGPSLEDIRARYANAPSAAGG